MSVRLYKPTTAGRRISSVDSFLDITKDHPEKTLLFLKKKHSGRTCGKITVRHRGGGAKKFIRKVDFLQNKINVPAKVVAIEYDPNRGARLALLHYVDGQKTYMLSPVGLVVGDVIQTSITKGDPKIGNRFPLEHIPIGTNIYNIELEQGKGGQIVRSAGLSAQLMAIEGVYATLKLPSGEIRLVSRKCMASIGQVSNPDHRLIRWGKAGRMRHRGIRPRVRGKVMNPVDHPHGGGEGRNSIGLKKGPKTPTGKKALGVKTRGRKVSSKFIVQPRKRGRFVGK